MNNRTEWIKNELYPFLFDRIDTALPEFNFKRRGKNWVSSNKQKITGEEGDSIGKVYVWENAPGFIKDFTRGASSIVDYVIRRDGVEFIQAVESLSKIAGLQLPKGNLSPEDYQRYKDRASLLESANSYFIYCLDHDKGADEVKDYLFSRGYSQEDITTMELGFIPSQEKLYKYLQDKGYSSSLIKLNSGIGSTHRLSIPYRSGGSIKGFTFRTIGDSQPKYFYSTGLDISGGFFNLSGVKGDKDILIVEGILDSLHATAKGIDNVVALGGANLSPEQIKDAIRRGAKSFTLCLDNDKAGREGVLKAIEVILGEGVNRVYIVTLPDLGGGKTDPDRFIKERGVEAFKDSIREASPYYAYQLQETLNKHGERELEPRDIDNLLEEIVETASKIPSPIDRDRYKKIFLDLDPIQELGITEESLDITLDRLTSTKEKEAQAKELKNLLSDATKHQAKGEIKEVLELLDSRVKEVKLKGAENLLPPPTDFNKLLEDIATIPPGYRTGYPSLDKFIDFTPGAISLIGGRPSHGKTTFMFNLLLEMAKLYPEEKLYFFSYEEPVRNISVKLLNRLTGIDLKPFFPNTTLSSPTNYEFIKSYIKAGRTDIEQLEDGKRQLKELIDSQRITIIGENYSVEDLSKLIAYLQKKEKIGAVFIDYIQRMRTERKTQEKRIEISHISDQTLQIAKETGLPIILGAQLNRATQDSKAGKPRLENLKEAGNLEEDANLVLSVYNESREKEETESGETYKDRREVELEFKSLKNREGEVNQTAKLTFDKWTGVIKESTKKSIF